MLELEASSQLGPSTHGPARVIGETARSGPEPGGAPSVAIIIPLHRDSPTFRECVRSCLALRYESFKVIVVSDTEVAVPSEVKLVLTRAGRDTGPGEKRDLGMRVSEADFFAFIDDDAAPDVHWLSRAVEIFDDPTVGAVGGPGVTPPGSVWAERAGGAFYESWLGSGPYRFRFRPGRRRPVDDYPAYNFILRRKAAEQVRGWGTGFYGGEDTVICLALVEAGWQIVYDPSVVVFHRRRPVLTKHLAQVGNVGRHRGYFVKA
ncbi:MAG: glycosyltransferase, partial [Chloroflexi bacterium]